MLKKSTATLAAIFASSTILVNTSFAAPNDSVHKEVQVVHAEQQKTNLKKQQEHEKKIENDKKLEEKKQKEHEKNQKGQQKKLESIDKQLKKIEEKITKYEVKFAEMDDDEDDDKINKDDQQPVTDPSENPGGTDSEAVNEENANPEEADKTNDVTTNIPEATEEDAEEQFEKTEEETDAKEESEKTEEEVDAEEQTEATEDLEKEIDEAVEEYNDYLGKFKALNNKLNGIVHQLNALDKQGVDNTLLTERFNQVAALQEKLNAAIAKVTQVQDKVIEKIKNDHDIEVKAAKEEKAPKKEWTIHFNKQLDEKTLSELAVIVYDEQHNLVETTMTYDAKKKAIIVTPMQSYKVGAQYTLYIGKEITSSNGEGLKKSVKMNFTIK